MVGKLQGNWLGIFWMYLQYPGWIFGWYFVHFLAMYLWCTGWEHYPLPPVSCMAFTSPYKDLDVCLECKEPCYNPVLLCSSNGEIKKPWQSMTIIPIGPQIQALWSHCLSAEKMGYWEWVTNTLLSQAELSKVLTDYTEGENYITKVTPYLKSHDTVLMFSVDGAQLYRSKKSDCWMYIWVIYNLTPVRAQWHLHSRDRQLPWELTAVIMTSPKR